MIKKHLILVIEDNPLDAELLKRRLTKKGYEVLIASDGEKGILLAKEKLPDCIIMDMGLPIIDGWEATKILKASPITSFIPIIALTAHALSEDRERGFQAGCDIYETKPLEFERLLSAIEYLTRKNQ
jgi:CheY-like chemotaxis protein